MQPHISQTLADVRRQIDQLARLEDGLVRQFGDRLDADGFHPPPGSPLPPPGPPPPLVPVVGRVAFGPARPGRGAHFHRPRKGLPVALPSVADMIRMVLPDLAAEFRSDVLAKQLVKCWPVARNKIRVGFHEALGYLVEKGVLKVVRREGRLLVLREGA